MYGNPIDMVSAVKEGTNISATSAKVSLVSEAPATQGKTLTKKLLLSMTVAQLKAMCSKLFKCEIIRQSLVYVEEGFEGEYTFDED